MEKEINIAEILKDKPQGTKLYDLLYNVDVELDTISTTDTETVVWCTNETDNNTTCHRGYSEFGTIRGCPDGLQILLPSKEMRYWRKFAWKKGDVLTDEERFVVFKDFNTDYTEFSASFEYKDGAYRQGLWLVSNDFRKVSDNIAQEIIKKVEEHYGGKLNLETLEIEQPKPEFKDGDILYMNGCRLIYIFKKKVQKSAATLYYASLDTDYNSLYYNNAMENVCGSRLATDSEKQQLFDALAKEGKRWNSVTKQIEDLPKKCEFKPMIGA